MEHEPSWRAQLRALQLPDTGGGASSGAPAPARLQLVPLLCELLAAVAPRSRAAAAGGGGGGTPAAPGSRLAKRLSLGSGEVTLDCLEGVDDGGACGQGG